MQTTITTIPRITARGCESTLDDSEIIPARYWNPGMEVTRGLIRGGFCAHTTILAVNFSGSMIHRGCWTCAEMHQS